MCCLCILFSGLLYMLFAVLLGAVCTREALLSDYMIASKVSDERNLFCWCDVMWCDVMWCDVMWCDVTVIYYRLLSNSH